MKATFARYKSIPFVLASILFLILWETLFRGMMYDDAYIAFRYSDHWAAGAGPVWNIGENPVEGFSSLAWVLIGAILKFAGLAPHISMRWVGVAMWFAETAFLVPALTVSAGEREDRPNLRPSAVAMALVFLSLAGNAAIGFQAFHGLETAGFSFAVLLFVLQALRSRTLHDYLLLAACALLLVAMRPDGAAILLPVYAVLFVFSQGNRKNILLGGVAAAALIGMYTAVKWTYYGYPFPNTFYIKEATEELAGKSYVIEYLTFLSPILLFLIYSAGRIRLVRALTDRTFLMLVAPAIFFTLAYVGIDPILGNIHRFVIPTLPLFVLAGFRLYTLTETAEPADPNRTFFTENFIVFAMALLLVNALFNVKVYRNYPFLQNYLGVSDETRQQRGHQLRDASELDPAPLLATGDVGALPYFSGLPTLDIIGLSDETIAHEGLTHGYALSRSPDLLILQDFYYTGSDLILMCGPQDYPNPLLNVKEKEVSLNLTRYTKVLDAPAIAHNGKGSTYQIVTMPGFADDYAYVTFWDFGGDQYHIFVRRAYPQFDALVEILTR